MAFSTGMTCMPMPAPPGGTISVMPASGRYAMRSKKSAVSGNISDCSGLIIMISALPGTNISSTQRFSWFGFLPSRFSQWYSTRPLSLSACSAFSRYALSNCGFFFASCSIVSGTRFFIVRAISRISSAIFSSYFTAVNLRAELMPRYSGASGVILSLPSKTVARSVISLPSFAIFSSFVMFSLPSLIVCIQITTSRSDT